jgi:uncharacterized RDD family membrane protein YckC
VGVVSENSAAGWALAIDFGTTNTTAAMAVPGGSGPQVLEIENSRYLPSVVYMDEAGQLVTGRAAVRQAAAFPERAERVPKRALVAGDQVLLGDRPVLVADLIGAVLRRVYTEAVRFQGGQPPAITVLTHPARWGPDLLGRLGAAAARAGIADPRLAAEPVGAAWWYARPSAGRVVAVFDLGGGTLDTAVLRATEKGYEIAGPPGGDANLGGEDFDELLLAQVSDLTRERDPAQWEELFNSTTGRARRDRVLLRADVTAAKEALSDHRTTDLVVVSYAEAFHLTRPEFEALIDSAITRGVEELRRTIAVAGLNPADLAAIYLTGGSSRIPAVSARIAAALGMLPDLRDDPKAVVALGALVATANQVPPPVPSIPAIPADVSGVVGAPPLSSVQLSNAQRLADRAIVGVSPTPQELYRDERSGLMLPQGTQLASNGRRIGAYFLAILLAVLTLGIGYIIWGLIAWANGQTPALQVLGMRCWRPQTKSVPGWGGMALRELVGVFLVESLGGWVTLSIVPLISFILMLAGSERTALHDRVAGTVVVHDPDNVLAT